VANPAPAATTLARSVGVNDRAAADNSTLTRDLHCICHPPDTWLPGP